VSGCLTGMHRHGDHGLPAVRRASAKPFPVERRTTDPDSHGNRERNTAPYSHSHRVTSASHVNVERVNRRRKGILGCRDARTTAVDSSGAVIGGDDPYAQTQEALPSRISVRDDRRPLR
jgi:hypothetical protein